MPRLFPQLVGVKQIPFLILTILLLRVDLAIRLLVDAKMELEAVEETLLILVKIALFRVLIIEFSLVILI